MDSLEPEKDENAYAGDFDRVLGELQPDEEEPEDFGPIHDPRGKLPQP